MCSGCKIFFAFCGICSRGWDEGFLSFLNLGLAPDTFGGQGHFTTHHQVSQEEAFHVSRAHNVTLLSWIGDMIFHQCILPVFGSALALAHGECWYFLRALPGDLACWPLGQWPTMDELPGKAATSFPLPWWGYLVCLGKKLWLCLVECSVGNSFTASGLQPFLASIGNQGVPPGALPQPLVALSLWIVE